MATTTRPRPRRPALLAFPIGQPRPATASLRPDVRASVQRSLHQLPILGQRDPDGALLIGDLIEAWIEPDPDGGLAPSGTVDAHVGAEVRQIRALAPVLGRLNPESVRVALTVIQNLLGPPETHDGRDQDRPTAARVA